MAEKLETRCGQGARGARRQGNRIIYDTEVKGFGCRITAAGAKSFVLNYRAGGRERRYTIGSFPDWSVVAARNEASEPQARDRPGARPDGRARARAPGADHGRALCDRYLAEHVDVHNKPRTRAENRRMVEQIIKPKIGRLKVEAVDHEDVARLHRELKRTPRQANHVVAVLSKMFNLAERVEAAPAQQQPLPASQALSRERARALS